MPDPRNSHDAAYVASKVGLLGLERHEVGAVTVARPLRDAGFEVVYTGRFNLPPGIVKTAEEEDELRAGLAAADRVTLLTKGVAAAFGPGAQPANITATMRRLAAAGVAPPP